MAKGILQQLLDAHLIENGADLSTTQFKERGIYMPTPKGLHILERFITKNGISADNLLIIFADMPITMKLLHLERRTSDDEIMITKSVIEVLFRRMCGVTKPNITTMSDEELTKFNMLRWYVKGDSDKIGDMDRSEGMPFRKVASTSKGGADEYHFGAMLMIDWLLDYSTTVGMDEATELAAQMVRYGLITLVSDKGRIREGNMVVTVRAGGAGGGAGAPMVRCQQLRTRIDAYNSSKKPSSAQQTRRCIDSPKKALPLLDGRLALKAQTVPQRHRSPTFTPRSLLRLSLQRLAPRIRTRTRAPLAESWAAVRL